MARNLIFWVTTSLIWGIAVFVSAQEADSTEESSEAAVTTTPPTLQTFVDAEYDPELLEPGDQIEVILTLTIDAEGQVSNAEVFQSGGEPFDTAAVTAGQQLIFSPARRGEETIAARIRFRYTFANEPAPTENTSTAAETGENESPATPPEPTTGRIVGRVLSQDDTPLVGAQVFLDAVSSDANIELTTNEEGQFETGEIDAGRYLLTVIQTGYVSLDTEEEVSGGEELALTYRLEAQEDDASLSAGAEFGAVTTVERLAREATRRTIPRELLTNIAGTRGDALRVVELLPGVARPAFGSGALYIRGSAPGDSEVFVDGTSVPLLYHFGGLTSFYNSRLLERLDFYPGNFSVRFGRKIGGILEVEPRDPATDQPHGVVDVNLLDAYLVVETPLWEGASLAIAARRSYVDFFFAEVIPDDVFDVVAAPVYYDYQLIFTWRPTDQDRIRVLGYGSGDEFRTIFNNDDIPQPFGLEISTQFHRLQASWEHTFSEDLKQTLMISGGWTGLLIQVGETFGFDAEFVPLQMRNEWEIALHERVDLTLGLDWQYIPTTLSFRGGTPGQTEGQPDTTGQETRTAVDFEGRAYRPGVYLESNMRPTDWLQVVLGMRLDYYRDIQDWTFDPRFSIRFMPTTQWTIRGGFGVFSQPPEFRESAPGLGNPDLEPVTALHSTAGFQYRHDETWRFSIDGYYKHIYNRIVGTQGGVAPFFVNDGVGRIYGMEVAGRIDPTPGFPVSGLLSYTLSRSERQDRDDQWRLFDFDQTHIFSLSLVWQIGDGWQAGGTFRLISGNPYTPVTSAIYDARANVYQPIYGTVNSERNPLYHRLDLRIEKVFEIDIVRLAVYVDVQNVYNMRTREALTYSFDYTDTAEVQGLPIFPSLGIRGEL